MDSDIFQRLPFNIVSKNYIKRYVESHLRTCVDVLRWGSTCLLIPLNMSVGEGIPGMAMRRDQNILST